MSSFHIFAFSSTGMSENSRARGNPKEAFDYVAHVLPNVSHILKLMKEQWVQNQEQNFAVLVAAYLTRQQQKDLQLCI